MEKNKHFIRSTLMQELHDKAVFSIAHQLETVGFTVLADHNDWISRPFKILDYTPDIVAVKKHPKSSQTERYIFEIETIESFQTRHAINQLNTFNTKGSEGVDVYWVIICRQVPWLSFQQGKAYAILQRYSMDHVQLASFDPINNRFEVYINLGR